MHFPSMIKNLLVTLLLTQVAGSALAQSGYLTAIHGVPGLAAPVEVRANGAALFSFDYGEQRGPLALAPATYNLEIVLNGATILQGSATVAAGASYTAIAHLDAAGGPVLSLFDNSLTPMALPSSRLYVRHTAQAPAVDFVLEQNGTTVATIPGLTNGDSVVADVAPGEYAARLNLAGTNQTAFGPVNLVVENGFGYAVHATGVAGQADFTLQIQRLSLASRVTVLHGIPGLGSPVTVTANGQPLFTFDYRQVQGPLVVNPATYNFDVVLNGSPVLSRTDTLDRFSDVTVVANLDGNGGPVLSAFANDTSVPANPIEARIAVRHLAQAPAVDAVLDNSGQRLATIPNLTNGSEAVAEVPPGSFDLSLLAAGTTTTAFGPVNFRPANGTYYELIAIGDFNGGSFSVEVLQRDLNPAVPGQITTRTGGWSCGPQIGAQPASFDFGEPFELVVQNAQPASLAIIQFGDSISSLGAGQPQLPWDLSAVGATGCFLQTNAIAILGAVTDGSGELRIGYTVPNFLFGQFAPGYFQVGTATTANSFGWVTTEYLELF